MEERFFTYMPYESKSSSTYIIIVSMSNPSLSVYAIFVSWHVYHITPFMDRYSRFTIDVVVARRPGFYTVKICLPFFMIVLMSLSVFAMDVSALNDRVGTGIEAALTATGAWDDGGVTGCYRVLQGVVRGMGVVW